MIRLIATPHRTATGSHLDRFDVHVEGRCGRLLEGTRQPLFDGARALIAAGDDAHGLVTVRHAGSSFDAFKPTVSDGRAPLAPRL